MPRINVEVPKAVIGTVDALQELSPTTTRTAFVIAALQMLLWALRQRARGRKIVAVEECVEVSGAHEFSDAIPVNVGSFAAVG